MDEKKNVFYKKDHADEERHRYGTENWYGGICDSDGNKPGEFGTDEDDPYAEGDRNHFED